MISIKGLNASYGTTEVLRNFSLNLTLGNSYALVGPSGCGKSTLMKILCGIHSDFKGEVLYNNLSFFNENISVGYVPQNYGLLDWKTVKDNIFLPLKLHKIKTNTEVDADEIIKILELDNLLKRYPLELSGGQRQRVSLARAFILQPDLLLMDEPFSSLDSFSSMRSQKLYLQLWRRYNITTLFITHNIFEAVTICKDILIMDKKSGEIIKKIHNEAFESHEYSRRNEIATSIINLFEQLEI